MNTNHSRDAIAPAAPKRTVLGKRVLAAALFSIFAITSLGMATGTGHAAPGPAPQVDRNWCWNLDVDRSQVAACRSSDPPMA
jgi:hypothetical protein